MVVSNKKKTRELFKLDRFEENKKRKIKKDYL
jgi:hypothetical protein